MVGGDFSFYQFPTEDYWRRLFGETPESLRFGLKVPEDVTVQSWPKHARYGRKAGLLNEDFMNADLFGSAFVKRLEPFKERVAVLMFEFGTFSKAAFPNPEAFRERLDAFLSGLPTGFRYAVEIRNSEYLSPAYLQTLARHQASHVLSSWTRMPELGVQSEIESASSSDFTVVRALLRKGRSYEEALNLFSPYQSIKEPNERGRRALVDVIERSIASGRQAYVFVNNRFEGCAPETIEAVMDSVRA